MGVGDIVGESKAHFSRLPPSPAISLASQEKDGRRLSQQLLPGFSSAIRRGRFGCRFRFGDAMDASTPTLRASPCGGGGNRPVRPTSVHDTGAEFGLLQIYSTINRRPNPHRFAPWRRAGVGLPASILLKPCSHRRRSAIYGR